MLNRQQPLSEQVRNQLLQWIQSDRADLENGVLPSEAELSELFNTSRSTIREALTQLERDRIIIRRQGSGTYINVALRKISSTLNELVDPIRMIELHGHKASIGWTECSNEETGETIGELLDVSAETLSIHARAQYCADKIPAIWLEAVIPTDPFRPSEKRLPKINNLFLFSAEISGKAATHSITTIRSIPADEQLSTQLNIEPGRALLALEEIYLTDYGHPVFWSRMVFFPDLIQLQVLRNSYRTSEHISIW